MEGVFNIYYCSVCHFCKLPTESSKTMKICSGCKLIQYCSIEHQKQDWPNHRELCKCVQHIMKRANMNQLFQEAINIQPEDLTSWNTLRLSRLELVELALKRPLNNIETQMILFPPVCNYCHLYKSNQMFICHLCKSVMYCSQDHQHNDDKHLSVCEFLSLSFDVDMLQYFMPNTMFHFIEFVSQCSRVKKLPGNIKEFIQMLTSTLTKTDICLSDPLSYILTLIFVIKISKMKANQVTIHILSADALVLLAMQTFPVIYHLLPHVMHLNIILVGPKVGDEDSISLPIEDSNLTVSSVNLLYHDYVNSPKFVTPDIIVAFNCGFCGFENEPAKDTWKESLPYILSFRNSVLAITSYTETENAMDVQRLYKYKSKDLKYNTIMKCEQNPFSSLYPHRDGESEGVYYINNYVTILIETAKLKECTM